MAITIKTTSYYRAPLHDAIFYTFDSTNKDQPNFKYVVDVYLGPTGAGGKVATLKPSPNPAIAGACLVDVAPVLRSYVSSAYFQGAKGVVGPNQNYQSGLYFLDYCLKVGEEYGTPATTYTNLTTFNGFRAVNQGKSFEDLAPNNLANPNDRYLMDFLSNRPRPVEERLGLTDYAYLTFYDSLLQPLTVEIKTFSASNALLNTRSFGIASPFLSELGYGPANINFSYPGLLDSQVSYYTLTVKAAANPDRQIKVALDCFKKFNGYVLSFLNRAGGYESAAFKMKNQRTAQIDRATQGRPSYAFNQYGAPVNAQARVNQGGTFREASAQVIGIKDRQRFKLTTEFLSDEASAWLFDLVSSPVIYLHYPQAGELYFIPVKITVDNYAYLQRVNDKLTPLEIEVEVLGINNAQYL